MKEDKSLKEFDKVASDIAQIKDKGNFVVDMTTDEGYEASKRFVLDITTPARTSLDEAHKSVKAYWIAGGKKVDGIKIDLMDALKEIQKPHQEAYKEVDRLKKEKKAKFNSDLQLKIDWFNNFKYESGTSDYITQLIQDCGEVDTSEGFYHRQSDAIKARAEALEFLNETLLKTVGREAEEARQKELAEENRIRQIEIDAQQAIMDAKQADFDRKQAEFDKAEQAQQRKTDQEFEDKRLADFVANKRLQEVKYEEERIKEELLHKKEMAALKIKQELEQKEESERLEKERIDRENKLRAGRTKNRNEAARVLVAKVGLTKEDAIKVMNLQSSGEVPFVTTNF